MPIRIPLFKGLLGYRVSLIHKSNYEKFVGIGKKELQALIACQGQHWPDSDILEDNQFQVARVVRFDSMFKMLNQGRCDYFPRSIFEGYAELLSAQQLYPDLMMFDEVILQYDFPMYYFVNQPVFKRFFGRKPIIPIKRFFYFFLAFSRMFGI